MEEEQEVLNWKKIAFFFFLFSFGVYWALNKKEGKEEEWICVEAILPEYFTRGMKDEWICVGGGIRIFLTLVPVFLFWILL